MKAVSTLWRNSIGTLHTTPPLSSKELRYGRFPTGAIPSPNTFRNSVFCKQCRHSTPLTVAILASDPIPARLNCLYSLLVNIAAAAPRNTTGLMHQYTNGKTCGDFCNNASTVTQSVHTFLHREKTQIVLVMADLQICTVGAAWISHKTNIHVKRCQRTPSRLSERDLILDAKTDTIHWQSEVALNTKEDLVSGQRKTSRLPTGGRLPCLEVPRPNCARQHQ